jgi:triacylglycerol lipase
VGTSHISRRFVLGCSASFAVVSQFAWAAETADYPWRLPPLRAIRVNDKKIAYFDQGTGPALVLIHGMSGSAAFEWGRVMAPLARRFRVIAPYQIGFAPSDQPDLPYDAATSVDYLAGFMTALGLTDITLAGESYGGWVVGHYAVAAGLRPTAGHVSPGIKRLVIVDGALQLRELPPKGARGVYDPAVFMQTTDFWKTQPKVDNSLVTQRVFAGPIFNQPVRPEDLARLTIPTLVVWGEKDELLPLEQGRAIASEIPGARLAIIPNCGHIPSVEKPGAFVKLLSGFARA